MLAWFTESRSFESLMTILPSGDGTHA